VKTATLGVTTLDCGRRFPIGTGGAAKNATLFGRVFWPRAEVRTQKAGIAGIIHHDSKSHRGESKILAIVAFRPLPPAEVSSPGAETP
jgi:hypothetical protein